MGVSKDFIKFRQYIRTQDLKVNEQYLLELFFEYHNTNYNYCFLTYDQIMQSFNTSSKNRISSTIKKLEKKGLIRVEKKGNNRYYIIGIENFLNTNNKHNDKNGTKLIDGQVSIEELTEGESKVIELTGMPQKQVKRLVELSKNKVDKVIEYAEYTISKGIKNAYGYIKKLIEVDAEVRTKEQYKQSYYKKSIAFVENCSSREYTSEWYSDVENRLLNWT